MNRLLFGFGLTVAAMALTGFFFAAASYRVPLWDDAAHTYIWSTLGPTLKVESGKLDVVFPPAPLARQRHILLAWDAAAGGYRFPVANPKNEECTVNKFSYHPPMDYTMNGNLLVPNLQNGGMPATFRWLSPSESEVVCSFEP